MSESVAVLMTVKSVWAAMVRLVCAGRTGALFTSLTVTVNVLVSLSGGEPLSTTRTVNVFVLGPCASVGVHVITPEGEMAAPVGAESKEYVSVFAGRSEEHTSELQSHSFISYAVFCLTKNPEL